MFIRIEIDQGIGWKDRVVADVSATTDQIIAQLPGYAIQYPHRLFVDGVLVAEITTPRGAKSKVIRHDAA